MSIQPARDIAPRYVSVRKAIAMFGISKATVYRMHNRGAVVISKMGRRTLVEVASIEAALRENVVVPRARRSAG